MVARLERHAKAADQTALAVELLRAAEYRKQSEMKQQEELRLQCQAWLRPSNVRDIHKRQVTARLDGTCTWINSNENFSKWIDPTFSEIADRLLYISGTHGCGKSILSSFIVSELEVKERLTLFFSFSNMDVNQLSHGNCLRTIL